MEKYAIAGQTTDDSIVRCMRVVCWITRATDLHSEYVILIDFLRQRMLKRTRLILRLYVMYCTRTLPVALTVDLASQSDQCSWCVRDRTYVSPSVSRSMLWKGPVMCRYILSAVGRLQTTTKSRAVRLCVSKKQWNAFSSYSVSTSQVPPLESSESYLMFICSLRSKQALFKSKEPLGQNFVLR